MSGIFPDESSGGVLPEDATNSYEPENTPTCDPRFFGRECQTILRPDQLNALISEILCAVDTLGFPYNCTLVCNLGSALQFSFDAVYARINEAIQGLDIKQSVRATTTADIALTGLQTIDGVNLGTGDRVLVKNQAAAAQNGIYVVAVGAWARSEDANTNPEVTSGMFTFVTSGTLAGKTGWVLTTPDPIVLGTTALVFEQFSAAGQVIDGPGLFFTGNVLGVGTASTSRIVVNPNDIDLAMTAVTPGSYGQVVVDAYGRVVAGGNDIADNVNVSPSGGISSTNVQDALEELDTEKARKDANLSDMVDKKASRLNLLITSVQAAGNTNAVVAYPATFVPVTAALTAARTYTLPLAAAYNPGEVITIFDRALGITAINKLSVIRAGADTVDGVATAVDVIAVGGGMARLVSNGVDRWDVVEKTLAASGGYRLARVTRYTSSGSHAMNLATRLAVVKVQAAGGGGGGASGGGSGTSAGGGGGSGAYVERWLTAGWAASETVTIGANGLGGNTSGLSGSSGSSSSFGTLAVATGGVLGSGMATRSPSDQRGGSGGNVAFGSTATGGTSIFDRIVDGFQGETGASYGAAITAVSGMGANSLYGAGGRATTEGGSGNAGSGYGSGGSGGAEGGATGRVGGNGAPGLIIVEEYE